MYSPLTLFADACTADAKDARPFNNAVNQYIADKNNSVAKTQIIDQLAKWSNLHGSLSALAENAPLIRTFLPLSQALSTVATQLGYKLQNNPKYNAAETAKALETAKSKEYADVELAVYDALNKLNAW